MLQTNDNVYNIEQHIVLKIMSANLYVNSSLAYNHYSNNDKFSTARSSEGSKRLLIIIMRQRAEKIASTCLKLCWVTTQGSITFYVRVSIDITHSLAHMYADRHIRGFLHDCFAYVYLEQTQGNRFLVRCVYNVFVCKCH